MWNDVRFGWRTLSRSPLFTAVAVLSLAMGIGANTAIFSLLHQVMFRFLPVSEPERLVVFHTEGERNGSSHKDNDESVFSYLMYQDLRDRSQVFSGVIARSGSPVSLSYGGQTERVRIEVVSGNFFEVLGVQPELGRLFTPRDAQAPGVHPNLVLSDGYWKRRFGANPGIIGQTIDINQHPMVVIGVAPPGFRGVLSGQTPEVMAPITMQGEVWPNWDGGFGNREVRWLNVFARLRPGISQKQAGVATEVLYRAISTDELAQMKHPPSAHDREKYLAQKIELRPAAQGINPLRADWETPLVALMAMVGLVLLIACANVANLMLARAAARQKEFAIRLAIGASRAAIVRQVIVEALLVALGGGVVSLPLANWTAELLLRSLPEDAAGGWLAAGLDLRLLGFSLMVSVVAGLLFGLAPAIQSMRSDAGPSLKQQAANIASGGSQARFRKAFIVGQVAISLLLLVGAGLFARSLFNLMTYDPGFRRENLLRFSIDASLNGYEAQRGWALYHEVRERLAALPGVRSAGGANLGPFGHNNRGGNITVEGYQPKPDEYVGAAQDGLTPDYFRTMGIRLLAGREFTDRDAAGAPKVVMVNEAFVQRYAGGSNLIGRHLAFGAGNRIVLDREIVGIVRDSKYNNLREPSSPFIYLPYAQQENLGGMTYFVRAAGNENSLGPQIRRLMRDVDANLPVVDMSSMQVEIEDSIYRDRLVAMLSSAFGLLATLLATVGLYGVVAFNVARRTAEIGVRMALGAVPRDVLRLVMKEVGWLVLGGVAIGLPAAVLLSRFVESQLFGIRARDPLVLAGATCVLAVMALLAGYIPARRAARIDPITALRYE